MVVRHWDGKAWRAVTPPRAYINSPLDQGAGPVAATSASNAWIFAGRGTESVDYTDALHWTGKGWALSPNDIWVGGSVGYRRRVHQ